MTQQDPANRPRAGQASSVFFLAELPYHELLRKRDPQKARQLEARMQQILGEAVYMCDGRVIDSVGPRMIAILPTAKKALEAARKSQVDLMEHNERETPEGEVVEAALVVHSGEQVSDGSAFSSPAVATGLQLLKSTQPLQLLVSEPALREAGERVPTRPSGEVAGVRFYVALPKTPLKTQPQTQATPSTKSPATATLAKPKKAIPVLLFGVLGALAILAIAVLLLARRGGEEAPAATTTQVTATQAPAPPPPPVRKKISIAPFQNGLSEKRQADRATRVQNMVTAVLRQNPGLELVGSGGDFELAAVPAATRGSITVTMGTATGPTVALDKPGAAAGQILTFIAQSVGAEPNELTSSNPVAIEKLEEASRTRSVAAIQKAMDADPKFLPAHRLAMELFSAQGDLGRAISSGQMLLAVDTADLETRRKVVKWLIGSARSTEAIPHLMTLLRANQSDAEALGLVARLSLSALDEQRFREFARRYEMATGSRLFHDPDVLVAQGRIDPAVQAYYELERADPQNSALPLKIGRLAVLRHSLSIAELELEKLSRLDPSYGYPLLQAYIQAEKRRPAEVPRLLEQAQKAATWKDDPFTATAEVYAILNEHAKVVDSLKIATRSGEATLSYILSNPLFRYLQAESPDYQLMRPQLEQQRNELRARLAELSLL